MSKTLSLANFKGGVGKTSTTALIAFNMTKNLNKKMLLIDFDAQANLTNLMVKTALIDNNEDNFVINKTLMFAIANNIDLIPNWEIS